MFDLGRKFAFFLLALVFSRRLNCSLVSLVKEGTPMRDILSDLCVFSSTYGFRITVLASNDYGGQLPSYCENLLGVVKISALGPANSSMLSSMSMDELRVHCLEPNDTFGTDRLGQILRISSHLLLHTSTEATPEATFLRKFNDVMFHPVYFLTFNNIIELEEHLYGTVKAIFNSNSQHKHKWKEYIHRIDPVFDEDTERYVLGVATSANEEWKAGTLPDTNKQNNCQSTLSETDQKVLSRLNVTHESKNKTDKQSKVIEVNDLFPSTTISHEYSQEIRILCMIYTIEPYHKAIKMIRETWGKRCDGFLAFSNVTDTVLSVLQIGPAIENWRESYHDMWLKSQVIWKLVATTLLKYYDFFILGGDDMYIIIENLREFLSSDYIHNMTNNHTSPIYLGRQLKRNRFFSFHSGGAGYVLNRAAVSVLYNLTSVPEPCLTSIHTSMEDVMVSYCLHHAGIYPTSTKDSWDLLETFHPLRPGEMYEATTEWFLRMAHSSRREHSCCSNRSISFHNIRPPEYMECLHASLYGY